MMAAAIPSSIRRSALRVICMCGVLVAPGTAIATDVGVGVDLMKDLSDGTAEPEDTTRFAAGPGLRAHARFPIRNGVSLRSNLLMGMEKGNDRVVWYPENRTDPSYSDDHYTLLTTSRLVIGPELDVKTSDRIRLYWGTQLGLAWTQNWHSFQSDMEEVFDLSVNDLDDTSNIDPFTSQWAPATDLYVGLELRRTASFAIQLEAGYSVSFLAEDTLRKSAEQVQALRTAYVLNPLRIGISTSFEVPRGESP